VSIKKRTFEKSITIWLINVLKHAVMIALLILVSFSIIGIIAVVSAIQNAPWAKESEDGKFDEQIYRN
jgi:hypothetical protein